MKWNESGFRPPLFTYRLNWARRTSWGWWDDWNDTVLQTQDSKFEPWRSEAEHATSRSRRLPTILTFTRGWGRNIFVSFKPPRPGTEPRTLAWKAAVLTTTLGPPPPEFWSENFHANVSVITMYFFHLPPTLSHLYPLQVENCDSNSRLVVDEDDNNKFRLARAKPPRRIYAWHILHEVHCIQFFFCPPPNVQFYQ